MGTDPYFYAGAPPVITSISPAHGRVGTTVAINGTDLGGVESVTFGGATATFSSGGPSALTATVPPGATSGPIRVTTRFGAAAGPVFGIVHDRQVTISIQHAPTVAVGAISVPDGFGGCLGNRTVRVQRKAPGSRWKTVIIPLTRADGSYRAHVVDRPGVYRALLKSETLSTGDVCARARSGVVH